VNRGLIVLVACTALVLVVPAWWLHARLTACPDVRNLGSLPEPIAYTAAAPPTPTTAPEIVDGHLALTEAIRGTVIVPVETIVDLTLHADARYFDRPRSSQSDVLPIITAIGDGNGGWLVSLRAAAPGDSTLTANHPRDRCPGPSLYNDFAVVVRVTPT
jgi:hypothetical protein